MLSAFQHTVARSISCSGIGLHSGRDVSLTLCPAPENTGIVFVREDISGQPSAIAARYDHVCGTTLGTTLRNEAGVEVATVEHLMAALAGMGIDNVIVRLDAPEVPIMDGSSAPFVFLIECAGVREQSASRPYLRVRKPVEVRDGDAWLRIQPSDGFSVSLEIDFNNPLVSRQTATFDFSESSFKNTVSRARSFCFAEDVERMQKQGLAQGGSLDNAIVVDQDRVMNRNGLRYRDEFVRHKVLDCVGDLYLAGAALLGNVSGSRSGHGLNNRLLRTLLADESAWELVTLEMHDAALLPQEARMPEMLAV